MMMKNMGLPLIATVVLASCTMFNDEPSATQQTTQPAPVQETKAAPVVVKQPKEIDFEAMAKAKAAERTASTQAEADAAKAEQERIRRDEEARAKAKAAADERAKRDAEVLEAAKAERMAKEEEIARQAAELRAQQAAAETAKREELARVEAEKQQQKEAIKAQAADEERIKREQAEAQALAQAETLRLQQEEQARVIAAAAEKTRQEAAAKAAAEQASVDNARKEAEARSAAEARARIEQQRAANAESRRQAAAAASAASSTKGFYLPKLAGAQLDSQDFTPMGAERKGNADGSIPAWTGSMRGVPAGLSYSQSGDVYPDPYARDKRVLTIHAGNADQYADRLSEGLKVMFKKYPDTFFMHIYPTHRDGRYSDLIEARTKWNLSNTKLVNGADGLQNYTGGAPFPLPKTANEALWNGRIIHPNPTLNGTMDDVAVYLNGNWQQRRQTYVAEFPFAYPENPVGKTNEAISINAAMLHVTIDRPERQKGQMTIVHEALDQVSGERMAWVYIPGSRRVRRAPTVGYDTPDGPGGLVTVDDSLGFNGAVDRYDWTLLGKKEMYVPYHNYKFDDPKVKYSTLLHKGHANPEYMRYELHRVWVVEANLKREARHVYAKRRFYIDEDSWHIVLLESYDGRGDLWRVGILNTVYDYAVKGFVARAQIFHDMQSGGYIAMRLVNETAPMRMTDTPKGDAYYSPSNLRTMGK